MNQTVLLIEDDENDVFFMQRAFQDAHIVTPLNVVTDGRQAIQYLKGEGEFSDREKFPVPCLILLDLKLPYVLGLDVLKWLREHKEFDTIIVVVLTSSKQDADIEKAYNFGANSYLVKPPDADQLLEMVKRIKGYWMEINQLGPFCLEIAHRRPALADATEK